VIKKKKRKKEQPTRCKKKRKYLAELQEFFFLQEARTMISQILISPRFLFQLFFCARLGESQE
jgi:hypothetical protein